MAEPPKNRVRMVVFLTEVDFSSTTVYSAYIDSRNLYSWENRLILFFVNKKL